MAWVHHICSQPLLSTAGWVFVVFGYYPGWVYKGTDHSLVIWGDCALGTMWESCRKGFSLATFVFVLHYHHGSSIHIFGMAFYFCLCLPVSSFFLFLFPFAFILLFFSQPVFPMVFFTDVMFLILSFPAQQLLLLSLHLCPACLIFFPFLVIISSFSATPSPGLPKIFFSLIFIGEFFLFSFLVYFAAFLFAFSLFLSLCNLRFIMQLPNYLGGGCVQVFYSHTTKLHFSLTFLHTLFIHLSKRGSIEIHSFWFQSTCITSVLHSNSETKIIQMFCYFLVIFCK